MSTWYKPSQELFWTFIFEELLREFIETCMMPNVGIEALLPPKELEELKKAEKEWREKRIKFLKALS